MIIETRLKDKLKEHLKKLRYNMRAKDKKYL